LAETKLCEVKESPKLTGVQSLLKIHGSNGSMDALSLYYMLNNISNLKNDAGSYDPLLSCSIVETLSQNDISTKNISANDISFICPSLINILENTNRGKELFIEDDDPAPSRSSIWGFGILAVTIISLCSLVGISVLPLMKKKIYDKILLYLISLAVGTLSANAIFQLIPEGFGIDEDPMTVWRSAIIFGGFYLFYLTDHILERIFKVQHDHSDTISPEENTGKTDTDSETRSVKDASKNSLCAGDVNRSSDVQKIVQDDAIVIHCESGVLPQRQCWMFRNYKSIKTVAWMITIADGIHNFIDGLAIGASFSVSLLQGLSTSIAIFCEEFPHELGDFAVLLNSGMSIKQAAFYNFASACCCYLGLIVGILIGNDMSSARWIFALAGGVFLYISLAGMLPEAKAYSMNKKLKKHPWLCLFLQHAGILTGFTVMFLLTYFKDKISVA
uniref:Zinc transporter ZIP14 n=1 Tax=Ciona savignyi TaxID=51511 RepID=H2YNF7_CIOSA